MKLMEETFSFIRDLKAKFDSKDPQQREEAMAEAREMQAALSSKLGDLAEKTGLNPEELAALVQAPSGVSPEERNLMETVKTKFDEVQRGHTRRPHDKY